MVNSTNEFYINTHCQVKIRVEFSNEKKENVFSVFSMCSDERLLQFLMSKDFTARYAGDDDHYEDERYFQERHQNLPPPSLIEQMVLDSFFLSFIFH